MHSADFFPEISIFPAECTSYLEALDYRLSEEDMYELDTKVPDSFPSWNDGIVDTNHRLWPWRSN